MAWPTDITAADRGRTLEVVFDDGETVRLTAERLRVESPTTLPADPAPFASRTRGGNDKGFKMPSPRPPPFDPDVNANQHSVPRLWQRRFADAAGHVYGRYRPGADPIRYSKPTLAGKARLVSVGDTMTEDWTYTVFDRWWRPSNEVEKALSKIEGKIAPVFDQIADPNVAGTPQLVQELCEALGLAACRTPWVMARGHRRGKELAYALARVHQYPDKKAFLADVHNHFGVAYSDAEYDSVFKKTEEELQAEADEIASMSPQDPRLPQQIALFGADMVAQAIANMELTLLHSPASTNFILGDTPLPDADLRCGFVVPICKKVALLASPACPGRAGTLNVRQQAIASDVADINRQQHAMSLDVVIGPDKLALDAL